MRAGSATFVVLLALAASAAGGCSAVIGGRPSPDDLLPCWIDDGIDPCPAGTRCTADPVTGLGRCAPMCVMGASEVCNNYDDNCDGRIDEPDSPTLCPVGSVCLDHVCQASCQVDADGDGFDTCADSDCDDTRADVNPGAREVCDGLDNNCDGVEDLVTLEICPMGERCLPARGETTPRCLDPDCTNFTDCDAGETCDPTTGNCIAVTSDCRDGGASACTGGERCDVASGVCVQLRDVGQPCTSDVQCGSDRCVPFGALMLPPDLSGAATGMCVNACCDDSHCTPGFRCWAPGNGVRACVPEGMLPISTAVAACSGPTCGGSDVCDARAVPRATGGEISMFVCQPFTPGSSTDTRVSCVQHSDCASGLCVEPLAFGVVPLGEGWCALPCRTSADCDYPINPYVGTFAGDRACGLQPLTSGERLQMCRDFGTTGPGTNGASCSGDGDCRDRYCRDSRCADICCSDADCAVGVEMCAPINRSGWEMRCVARLAAAPP